MIKFKLPKKNQVALKAGIERQLDERRDDVFKIIYGMITDIHRDATMRLQQITNEGRLASGLKMDKPTKQRMYGQVFNDVDYAPFVEFGTKSKVFNSPLITPELKKFARQFKGSRGGTFEELKQRISEWAKSRNIPQSKVWYIATQIARHGIDSRPTLYPSFDNARYKAIRKLKQIK